jgi:DnaJ-domain-containing protein 1
MKWRDVNQGAQRLHELKNADPYALFNVESSTDLPDIRRAYRAMVSTYHPDRADPFMRPYCDEILKILNAAMARIEREHKRGAGG